MKKRTLSVIFLAVVFVCFSFAGAGGLEDVLDKVPAQTAEEEKQINEALLKAGPEFIGSICDLIVPPGTGDDTMARYTLSSLVSYVSKDAGSDAKKMYSEVLVKALAKASNKEVKAFFISQLQFAGTGQCVEAVGKYLADERLCEPAAFTLQTINTGDAKRAVVVALGGASNKTLPTLIHAIGQMRVEEGIDAISGYATSMDRTVRLVTLGALAQLGNRGSIAVMKKALEVNDPYERGIVASNYVGLAKRLLEKRHSSDAVKICDSILKSNDVAIKSSDKAFALMVVADALGSKADNYIEKAFEDGDGQLQRAAMTIAAKLDDSSVVMEWGKKLDKVSQDRRVKIAEMLGERGDKDAVKYLRDAYKDGNAAVKGAILAAIVNLDRDGAVADLMKAIDSDDEEEIAAARGLLEQMKTEEFAAEAIRSLTNVSDKGKVALIELLAERGEKEALEPVFVLAGSENSSVSTAAVKALAKLAGPDDLKRVIGLMFKAEGSGQRNEACRVIVELLDKMENAKTGTDILVSAMKNGTKDQKKEIIGLMSSVATKEALGIVVEETKNSDSDMSDAAIRSLAKWKNAGAMDALLGIAKDTDQQNYHVITLKAYADLAVSGDINAVDKAECFKKALNAARRDQEKKYIVSRLSRVREVEALKLAVELLDDEGLAANAEFAVSSIALPDSRRFRGLQGPGVGGLLLEAYSKIERKSIREKIEEYIKQLAEEDTDAKPTSLMETPEGFVSLFNGKDLTGWKGLLGKPYDNPIKRQSLSEQERAEKQAKADELMGKHWHAVDGVLYFDGGGDSIATASDYGDFEMLVDWKLMSDKGDSGIYLRGSPQVQIWDPKHSKVGSGGLYNNKKHPSKPSVTADNPVGEWNNFRIKMVGDKVTVYLNDVLVVDNVTMENYWDRAKDIFSKGQIELQCHGDPVCFKNIFIRRIVREDEFVSLFNGRDLAGWVGDTKGYGVKDGAIVCLKGKGGNLYTEKEYSDFVLRFQFKLYDGTNNGLGIRAPIGRNAAYHGMEIQILDNTADKYRDKLKPYQYHGSIYGVMPAKRGYLKPVGDWNTQEVTAKGNKISVVLNNVKIVDTDIKEVTKNGTMDGREHPGLFNKSGHIGFLGHGSVVEIKDIEIKELGE